jgi:VIT1/CCC1 family predicted Fe2+/Mn2+ transporter
VAKELTAHDAIGAHLEAELGIDERGLTNPWHAAFSSALAFLAGATLPMLAITLPPEGWRIPLAFGASLIALAITGWVGARLGDSPPLKPVLRVLAGGTFALLLTWGIGTALGVSGI